MSIQNIDENLLQQLMENYDKIQKKNSELVEEVAAAKKSLKIVETEKLKLMTSNKKLRKKKISMEEELNNHVINQQLLEKQIQHLKLRKQKDKYLRKQIQKIEDNDMLKSQVDIINMRNRYSREMSHLSEQLQLSKIHTENLK